MKEEENKKMEVALAAVNAAINPHGFKAEHMDTSTDGEEIYFRLSFIDEAMQKEVQQGDFEATYYTKPKYGKDAGYIAFGVMEGDWIDLPANPAKACEIFARWSRQKPLDKMIEEVTALTEPIGLQELAVALNLTPLQITQLNEIGSQIGDGYETYNSVCDSLSREEDAYLRKWLEKFAGMTFNDVEGK